MGRQHSVAGKQPRQCSETHTHTIAREAVSRAVDATEPDLVPRKSGSPDPKLCEAGSGQMPGRVRADVSRHHADALQSWPPACTQRLPARYCKREVQATTRFMPHQTRAGHVENDPRCFGRYNMVRLTLGCEQRRVLHKTPAQRKGGGWAKQKRRMCGAPHTAPRKPRLSDPDPGRGRRRPSARSCPTSWRGG